MDKISIIVPVYNVELYIGECIESILRQDYKNLEIIFIDDGCNDSSINIVKKYEATDKRIVLIRHESNKGAGPARNTGVEYASGKYIMFVDPDDILNDGVVNIMHKNACETNSDIVVCNNKAFTNEKDDYFLEQVAHANSFLQGISGDRFIVYVNNFNKSRCSMHSICWGKLFLTSFIKSNNIKFIDMKIGHEDEGFFMKYLSCAPKVSVIEDTCILYRIRRSSVMTSAPEEYTKRRMYELSIVIDDAIHFIYANSVCCDKYKFIKLVRKGYSDISYNVFTKIKDMLYVLYNYILNRIN